MARLFQGEKTRRKRGILRLLQRCRLGLTEAEIAQELGWERRTANNYLRELAAEGRVHRQGRAWYAG